MTQINLFFKIVIYLKLPHHFIVTKLHELCQYSQAVVQY